MKKGFDNEKYLSEQTAAIFEKVSKFGNKLYLEFGGKLLFDYHASRVLPGYDPNVKIELLKKFKDNAEVILCIYAEAIEKKKIRVDFGRTYDADTLKMIDDLRDYGIDISGVVITRYEEQPSVKIFKKKLERRGIKVYTHKFTKGYPTDVDLIVSEEGYGANEYIETTKPLVIVTGPGPCSGKLATCLSQLYHENKRGVSAGYAKFETFPIWNLPVKHPVNIAYEAATAELKDYNLIDPFHLESYNEKAINYNRDVEIFPVLKRILEKITGQKSIYNSPTDMGVNRAGFGIIDDWVVRRAAEQEVIRRYFRYNCEYVLGFCDKDTIERVELLMKEMGVILEDRKVVNWARKASEEAKNGQEKGDGGFFCGGALELLSGEIITGKNSPIMHASSALVLNAVKKLAQIPDEIHLLSPHILNSVRDFKASLGSKNTSLSLDETLTALSIGSEMNPSAKLALEKLKELRGCEVHLTHMPNSGDETGLRKLGVNLTSESNFSSNSLFAS